MFHKIFCILYLLIYQELNKTLPLCARFSNPDRSLNHKRERFKVFEVELKSNQGRIVMAS